MSLEFLTIGLTPAPPPVRWLWEGRAPLGCVTMIGGPGGVGKSALLAGLEVAVASGLPFLGAPVAQGDVIHTDFDTDLRLQHPWYGRAAAGMNAPRRALDRIHYARPVAGQTMLTFEHLEQLRAQVRLLGAALVVIDAFTSAFAWIRGNNAEEVAQVMAGLRAVAEDGPAVVVLDHTPKPSAKDPEGRGLIGSTIKSAGARVVHLLSRVPPRDVEGLDVLRLDTHKNNLAPIAEAVGVQRLWEGDAVRFEPFDLADDERASSLSRAKRAILEHLDAHPGLVVSRKDLLAAVVARANVSERTFKRAAGLVASTREVAVIEVGGQGNPLAYKSVLPAPLEPLAPNETSVQDAAAFGARAWPGRWPWPQRGAAMSGRAPRRKWEPAGDAGGASTGAVARAREALCFLAAKFSA